MFSWIIPWLLISQISLIVSIIAALPIILFISTVVDMRYNGDASAFIPFLMISALILCIFIPIHAYAESQRPYTITPEKQWTTTQIQNITSLSDDQRWSMNGGGSFFLGCGQVSINGGSVPQYIFYKVTPQGYQLGTLDATNVFIKEDENNYPYIEWDYSHSTTALKQWSDDGSVDYTLNGAQTDTLTNTYIHVPKGTIIKDYSLDSKLGK